MPPQSLREQLIRDEGEVLHVYLDKFGIRTGGVGHNLVSHGINWVIGTPIPQQLSDEWLDSDIQAATAELLSKLPWVANLDQIRQEALVNMCFNMGIGFVGGKHGLLSFRTFLSDVQAAIPTGNYQKAADDELHTLWYGQVGIRAVRLRQQMLTGVRQ